MDPLLADLRQRFFAKIAHGPGSCVDWIGARRVSGYGLLSVEGKLMSATHVSWRIKTGEWPTLKVLHTCDRPVCVNPEHLFEGTDLDNARDCADKGRSGGFKLDGLEVSEIIALTDTRMSLDEIAGLFGVTPGYVSNLRHGKFGGRGIRPDKPMACRVVVIGGIEMSLAEAARATGLSYGTLKQRAERGMVGEDLIAAPGKAPRKPYVRGAPSTP